MTETWEKSKFVCLVVWLGVLGAQRVAWPEENIQMLCHQGLAQRNQYLDRRGLDQLEASLQAGKIQKRIASKVVGLIEYVVGSIPSTTAEADGKSIRLLALTIDTAWIALRELISLAAYDDDKKEDVLEGFRLVDAELKKALDALSRLPPGATMERVQEAFGCHRTCLRTMVELLGDPNLSGNLVCSFSKDKELAQRIRTLGQEVPSKIDRAFYWATRTQNLPLIRSTLETIRKDLREDAQKLVQALQGEFAKGQQKRKELLEEIRVSKEKKRRWERQVVELEKKVTHQKATPAETSALVQASVNVGQVNTDLGTYQVQLENVERFLQLATEQPLYFCKDPTKEKK